MLPTRLPADTLQALCSPSCPRIPPPLHVHGKSNPAICLGLLLPSPRPQTEDKMKKTDMSTNQRVPKDCSRKLLSVGLIEVGGFVP